MAIKIEIHLLSALTAKSDGNGEIDFPEFLMLMGRYMKDRETEEELKSGFESIDKDKDNVIGRADIKTILNNLPDVGKLNEDEIKDVLEVCDLNQDGKFTYEDFVKLMMVIGFSFVSKGVVKVRLF